jgi:hypothetical protein
LIFKSNRITGITVHLKTKNDLKVHLKAKNDFKVHLKTKIDLKVDMNTNNDLTVHQVLLLRLTANQAKFYVYILIKDIVLLLLICLRTYNNVSRKYHTVETIPKSNIKIIDTDHIYTPNTQIHDRSLFWLGIGTSIRIEN